MSNTNTNFRTQTSNALHNAIIEAGGKVHPPMLALNPPYKFKWTEKTIPVEEGTDNDIYFTIDACLNACEIWKEIKRLKQEQADWRDNIDKPKDQKLEAHYMYMAHIQEVTPDAADNSGPIFDADPLKKVQNYNDNYNVFTIESEHPKQPESVNDTYPVEQDEHNIIIDSLDMSYDREHNDQDDNDDLSKERDCLLL
nr:hypothetical protein [Tanacetum cinerariifolium]